MKKRKKSLEVCIDKNWADTFHKGTFYPNSNLKSKRKNEVLVRITIEEIA